MAAVKVDVKELLRAGAHFGHKPSHWNPRMQPYIYGERAGIYIIDLLKTVEQLQAALDFVAETVTKGGQILFVGTKRHIREAVKEAAQAAKMPYITDRWFGGALTNFETIAKRVKQLKETESKFESGELAQTYNKRELGEIKEEMAKMNQTFGGIKELERLPAAIFVADVVTDGIAIKEASKLKIPIIGVADTNADPSQLDYVIAANDDAVSSVTLISNLVAQTVQTTPVKAPAADKPARRAKPAAAKARLAKTPSKSPVKPKTSSSAHAQ